MAAKIRYRGDDAVIDGGRWLSENKALERLLSSMTGLVDIEPRGSDPNPDMNVAERVIAELGDAAILLDYDEPELVEGRVY